MLLPISKLLIGVGTSSICAAGAYGIVYLADNSVKSLHDTDEYSSPSTENPKFGEEFSYYFLSTKEKSNLKIWESRADTLRRNKNPEANLEDFFKDIKKNANSETLKNKCKEKYEESLPTSHRNKWKGIWIYCSIGGMRPKTISESMKFETKYKTEDQATNTLFGTTLKDKLISTKDPDNQWFWKLRQREFKNEDLKITPKSLYFSTHTTETIQRLCERAYEMKSSETPTSTTPSTSEIEKYCSIKRIEQPQE